MAWGKKIKLSLLFPNGRFFSFMRVFKPSPHLLLLSSVLCSSVNPTNRKMSEMLVIKITNALVTYSRIVTQPSESRVNFKTTQKNITQKNGDVYQFR